MPLYGQIPISDQDNTDSIELIQRSPHTDAEAAVVEQSLAANPDDRLIHIHLFGYYWLQSTLNKRTDLRHKLVVQADWFAVHEPQSAVFDRSAFALEKTDFDPPYAADLATYKAHWKSSVDSDNQNDTKVLAHALTALHLVDIQVPLLCTARLRTLEQTYPQFAVQLAFYFGQFISNPTQQAAPAPGTPDHSAFTVLMNSNDPAVIGLTGQYLYGLGRVNGKTEAYLPKAEALLKKAHELDPANKRWVDALQSAPPASDAAAIAVIGTLTEADLWANGKVPPIEGSSDALVVDASTQAAKLSSPSAAFVQNALSSTHLGPANIKLKALIGEDGKVRALQFESGSVRHFPTALSMVKDWKYYPTLSGANHVKVLTIVDLNYTAYVPPTGGVGGGIVGGVAGMGEDPSLITKNAAPKKIVVDSKVMAGNILVKTRPDYPAVAKAARIQGIVVLQALISKEGVVETLTVIFGPPLLQQSALDAVKTWRYKPYLLNGEPIEVGTQVNVVYALGGPPPPTTPSTPATQPQ